MRFARVGWRGASAATPSRAAARAALEGFALAGARDQAVVGAAGGGATGWEGRTMIGKRGAGTGLESRSQPCRDEEECLVQRLLIQKADPT